LKEEGGAGVGAGGAGVVGGVARVRGWVGCGLAEEGGVVEGEELDSGVN